MNPAGQCPHPEKRRWPVRDAPGGLACPCGHTWVPYAWAGAANRFFHHDRRAEGDAPRLAVYRCRDRTTGMLLDHMHTTDQAKAERLRTPERLDPPVKDAVVSSEDIQRRSRWSRRRKAKPTTRDERRRLRRHRRT